LGAVTGAFPALLAQLDGANASAWLRLHVGSSFDMLLYLLTSGRQSRWDRFAHAILLHLM
jgi:hypothetical protein